MRKNAPFWIIGLILVLLLVAWAGITVLKPSLAKIPASTSATNSQMPTLSESAAPWPVELTQLRARLAADGLPALSEEGTAYHIHQHLDIFIEGVVVPVPLDIGINEVDGFISPIHVHDTSGIIHVESPVKQDFTLGQFFDIWGVRFTAECIGGYCASGDKTLRVYVNGALLTSNPRALVLAPHQEIVITYGAVGELPKPIPASYVFPAGY